MGWHLIGISSSVNEITPCNLYPSCVAQAAKAEFYGRGRYPLHFETAAVSDGISTGDEDAHFPLVSGAGIAHGLLFKGYFRPPERYSLVHPPGLEPGTH